MTRMTAKYKSALNVAHWRNIDSTGDQEDLYQRLQNAGFFWNSKGKEWEEYDPADAEEPTPLIMVRIFPYDPKYNKDYLDHLIDRLEQEGSL